MVEEAVFTGPTVSYVFRLMETSEEVYAELPAWKDVFEKGGKVRLTAEPGFILTLRG